jgi:hypothetical protein
MCLRACVSPQRARAAAPTAGAPARSASKAHRWRELATFRGPFALSVAPFTLQLPHQLPHSEAQRSPTPLPATARAAPAQSCAPCASLLPCQVRVPLLHWAIYRPTGFCVILRRWAWTLVSTVGSDSTPRQPPARRQRQPAPQHRHQLQHSDYVSLASFMVPVRCREAIGARSSLPSHIPVPWLTLRTVPTCTPCVPHA